MLVNPGLRRFLGSGDFVSLSASFSSPNITITATTGVNLTAGRFGAAISVNGGAATWYDGAGAASSQSLTISVTDPPPAGLGASLGDLICIDVGYSLTDPATTKVYASASSLWITPSVSTITISGLSNPPVVAETATGVNGTALAPGTVVAGVMTPATRSVVWVLDSSESSDVDNSYTIGAGDVGKTLKFRNKITFGSTTNFDSAATAAIVSGGQYQIPILAYLNASAGKQYQTPYGYING